MSIINSILSAFFGNKAERDMKEIKPYVDKVIKEYDRITGFTNDQLRAESDLLKRKMKDAIQEDENRITRLKEQAEDLETPVDNIEKIYKEIDHIEKDVVKTIENTLNEMLPVAFAIIKDTARRFKENERVVVTANDFDRDLSIKKNNVLIEGDKAVYLNHWMAGGNTSRFSQCLGRTRRTRGNGERLPLETRLGMDGSAVRISRTVGGLYRQAPVKLAATPTSLQF